MSNYKYKLECVDCGAIYHPNEVTYLCPTCDNQNTPELPPKGVLKINYNYDEIIASRKSFLELKNDNFLDIMPIVDCKSLPNLSIGKTPLYKIDLINKLTINFNQVIIWQAMHSIKVFC